MCNVKIPSGLGEKMVLSWDEIHEMNDNGIYFGAHTKTHPILTNENLKEAKKEIVDSKKTIEDHLKIKIRSFSYPNGSFNNEVIQLVKNCGFDCAVATNQSLINKYNINDIYNLPRIGASSSFSLFKITTSGIYSDFHSLFHIKN
jgi:peptidoglycan/xylan/chitin deacetylase (PgdA/CDA1 family)